MLLNGIFFKVDILKTVSETNVIIIMALAMFNLMRQWLTFDFSAEVYITILKHEPFGQLNSNLI